MIISVDLLFQHEGVPFWNTIENKHIIKKRDHRHTSQ